jgi:hypothetical protein
MRIAQVATVSTPVRREGSASIEGLAWLLTRELVRLGHEVTLFATAGSESAGALVATLPGPYGADGAPDDWHLCEWVNLAAAVERSAAFDVLHSHAYLWGLPLERFSRAPMVHTLHVWPFANEARLRGMWPSACVTRPSSAGPVARLPALRAPAWCTHAVDASGVHVPRAAGRLPVLPRAHDPGEGAGAGDRGGGARSAAAAPRRAGRATTSGPRWRRSSTGATSSTSRGRRARARRVRWAARRRCSIPEPRPRAVSGSGSPRR